MSSKTAARFELLDILRAATIFSMIAYHSLWDLCYLFDVNIAWFDSDISYLWQQSICWVFILLSGFCWSMGHHPVKRGATVLGISLAVSAVTFLVMPEERIFFGVLTLLGVGMLVLIPTEHLFRRIPAGLGLLLCAAVFVFTRTAKDGVFGFEGLTFADVPDAWYHNLLTAALGFPPEGFYSSDYFPIFPWLFLYFAGYFLYRLWREAGSPMPALPVHIPPLITVGRHSLLIYILHQPVIYGVLYLLDCANIVI